MHGSKIISNYTYIAYDSEWCFLNLYNLVKLGNSDQTDDQKCCKQYIPTKEDRCKCNDNQYNSAE